MGMRMFGQVYDKNDMINYDKKKKHAKREVLTKQNRKMVGKIVPSYLILEGLMWMMKCIVQSSILTKLTILN